MTPSDLAAMVALADETDTIGFPHSPVCQSIQEFDGRVVPECTCTRRRFYALAAAVRKLAGEVAILQGDRCDVCDENGLIYAVTGFDGEREIEAAEVCSLCEGTRSGAFTRVVKERDAAIARAEKAEAALIATVVETSKALDGRSEMHRRAQAAERSLAELREGVRAVASDVAGGHYESRVHIADDLRALADREAP